ncbi:MAG TPA: rod shape-determining protein, partial [Anaerolineaceae bacterium]|nr:rod shape-determining protein [Anaerolineaceae bacterium]
MAAFSRELGIDLGTFNTQIAEGNQILIQEPTIVAIVKDEMKLVEYGTTALGMLGRVPDSIEVVRPLRNSVIAEYELTEKLLSILIRRVTGPTIFFRPRIIISVPYGITSVERRAVQEAGLGRGDVLVAISEGGETSSVIGTIWQSLDNGAEVFFAFNNPAPILAQHIERSR